MKVKVGHAEEELQRCQQNLSQKDHELQELQLYSDKMSNEAKSLQKQLSTRKEAFEALQVQLAHFDAGNQDKDQQVGQLQVWRL